MGRLRQFSSFWLALVAALVVFGLSVGTSFAADVTTPFAGKAVNGGTVTHDMQSGKHRLTVSADFQVPGSPDPHWQVVDTKGTVYPARPAEAQGREDQQVDHAARLHPGRRQGPDVVCLGGSRARRGVVRAADRDEVTGRSRWLEPNTRGHNNEMAHEHDDSRRRHGGAGERQPGPGR